MRNDACYHGANVKVVSVGGGFSYGPLGMSHHATEDLSIMRAVPGIVVCAPGSAFEALRAVDALIAHDGPAYLRLERAAANFSDDPNIPFILGRARVLRDGRDLTLFSIGGITAEAVAAAEKLDGLGIRCRVLSMHTLKPLDVEAIKSAVQQTGAILTVEENSILGGLGGAVAEVCLEAGARVPFRRLGIQDTYVSAVGDQSYLRTQAGIDSAAIVRAATQLLHA